MSLCSNHHLAPVQSKIWHQWTSNLDVLKLWTSTHLLFPFRTSQVQYWVTKAKVNVATWDLPSPRTSKTDNQQTNGTSCSEGWGSDNTGNTDWVRKTKRLIFLDKTYFTENCTENFSLLFWERQSPLFFFFLHYLFHLQPYRDHIVCSS